MYKYLLTALIIAFFAGCSAPKPETPPSWYTTLPTDFNFIYAKGSGANVDIAKKKAIASLRQQINKALDDAFINKTSKLHIEQNQNIDAILKANEYLANTLSMRAIQIDKTIVYKEDTLILIKLNRKTFFDYLQRSSTKKFNANKLEYANIQDEIAIKRFLVIDRLMQEYPKLASKIQAKNIALPSYDTRAEFNYLNELRNSYVQLKDDITFYVLSDVNSRIFSPAIKTALRSKGLTLSTNTNAKDALKLLITSKTTNTQNYSFNQSKSLVKFITYDKNKKQVAFRQHTFIGKSRKSYKEAKQQSAIHVKSKIAKTGILNFIGFK